MADISRLTYRATILHLATATLGVDAEWDRCLGEYLRLDALQSAEASYGQMGAVNDDLDFQVWVAKRDHGSDWHRDNDAVKRLSDEGKVERGRWEERCCKPFWEAGRVLIRTRAPSVGAAAFKALLIEAEALWNDRDLALEVEEVMQIIADDFAQRADASA